MPSPHAEDSVQDICVPAIPPPPDRPPASPPKLHAAALEKKLRSLENRKPLETFVRLRAELPKVSFANDMRTQLKLLELIRNAAEPPVTSVEHALRTTAVLPPFPETVAVAKAGCHLLAEMTQAYLDCAQQLTRWSAPSLKRPLLIAIARGVQLADAALRLAYRAYMPAQSAVWQSLHALYSLALQQGLETQSLTADGPTPKSVYIDAILLAMADPAEMSASEFDRVVRCIQRCASFARLTDPPPSAATPAKPAPQFLIRQGGDSPGLFPHYTATSEHVAGDKVLECRYILKEIQRLIVALEDGLPPRQPGELTDAPVRSHVDTLRRLYNGLAATKKPRKTGVRVMHVVFCFEH